jgi:ubiquinol-cytochrome c reductase cytochrome b subunit
MGILRRLVAWVVDRLGLRTLGKTLLFHPVPAETAGRKGWMYVFGNASLAFFVLQVITGIALATKYIPSPEHAYQSVQHITNQTTFGALLRALHFFGASAMLVLVALHMARVFLTGSYKFPREMNWITGVFLGLLTLTMAFTGQLLRWDEAGLWGLVVAASFVERVPLVGAWLADFVLAGDSVGGSTLTRFYVIHVIVLPGLIGLFVALHLFLLLHHGSSEPPKAGEPVDPRTYRARYAALLARGRPYFPDVAWREAVFAALVFGIVVALALTLGPHGPAGPPDPTRLRTNPIPDWFVIWYYALLFVKGRGMETFFMVYLPIIVVIALLALPLVAGKGERSPSRRPWAWGIVLGAFGTIGTLIVLGYRQPWALDEESPPVRAAELPGASPEALLGAELFRDFACQTCHQVRPPGAAIGRGGRYGPDLTDVSVRLSPELIAVRTLDGYGDMPAYRDRLSPEELDAIVAFLRALRDDPRTR